VLDSFPDITVFAFGPDLRYSLVAGAGMSGWRPEEILGHRPSEVIPDPHGSILEQHMSAALRGETRCNETPGIRRDAVWVNTIAPLRAVSGTIVGGTIVSRDMATLREVEDARDRSERQASTLAAAARLERWQRERLEFLAEINDVLSACADRRTVMQAATRAAVPRLGDWCSIHVLLDPDSAVPAVEVAHVDPAMVTYARELEERFPFDPEAPNGVPAVMRTGRAELYSEIDQALLDSLELSEDAVAEVRRLNLLSAVTVPLMKRDRVLGAMQFVIAQGDRRYDSDDLTLAQAVAGRVAASLDNRRLSEHQREIAETLQRSLLPAALPAVPGADLAVRYWAAGEGAEVGGDFYDVFPVDERRHAVVIGDVCGNGPTAAAVTGMVRHNIRANAWRGDRPQSVLRDLNFAMLQTWPDVICTVALVMLEPSEAGLQATVATAGHPLPILVRAGGTTTPVGRPGLVLGVFDMTRHPETVVDLAPGDSLVLYTDGATDLPPPAWLETTGLERLVAGSVGPAEDAEGAVGALSDALGARTPFSERTDDVALVVVRATPPD
jgi:serine phosphatase RsbU (regulator of sigma subunit)